VVGEYLEKSGLQKDLDKLGFNLVGYGCTTCIGNSGPLPPAKIPRRSTTAIWFAAAVLSGNRNFEGRVNADVRANYLASPPLVVAYSIAGSMNVDMIKDALGVDQKGKKVFLKDIWPSNKEIGEFITKNVTRQIFTKKYADVFKGDANWRKISIKGGMTYAWDKKSTYVQKPAVFRRHEEDAETARRHRRCARAGVAARLDHHRPHFAGWLDQDRFTGRKISDRAQGQACGLQPIRHAARQSRSE